MHKQIFITLLLIISSLSSFASTDQWTLSTPNDKNIPSLIPYPSQVTRQRGKLAITAFACKVQGHLSAQQQNLLKAEVEDIERFCKLTDTPQTKATKLNFVTDSSLSTESYQLQISKKGIQIKASNFGGFFNALQTLRQLIYLKEENHFAPCCKIEDTPAFSYRGIMLDIGRNYLPIDFIKTTIRRLAHYKINVLHLHLTEDPAWRIEVKKHPNLTHKSTMWKTRQPGKYYTQEEIKELCLYCDSLNMRVIPEVDMPGHSAAFRRAVGKDMQTPEGMQVLKEALDEIIPLFKDSLFHIGSDEVQFKMKEFMPEMIQYVRNKGKQVVVWYPGYSPDTMAVRMCWGEYEAGYKIEKSAPYIDCNGFYMDWMDSQGGVLQTFFQQPCETPIGNSKALGAEMCVWTDGALSGEDRVLLQYPFYPTMLTFAERVWRGSKEKRYDLMANLPIEGSKAWIAFNEFEDRLIQHRDQFFHEIPFPYVKQSQMKWRMIGPFDHNGVNNTSFEPERKIKKEYLHQGQKMVWLDTLAYGGSVQIRPLYAMFNMHYKRYNLDLWPTLMSSKVGSEDGTCYALTHIESSIDQEIYLMFGLNGMWGHSGGYRSARAPEDGSWDFSGGDIWINGTQIPAPQQWPFESLPWTGWGKGRIETPLTQEGYFYRPPVKIKLKKGVNEVLIRSVFGHWKEDTGQRKWQFCCIPVQWDGCHYTEVEGLRYLDPFQ